MRSQILGVDKGNVSIEHSRGNVFQVFHLLQQLLEPDSDRIPASRQSTATNSSKTVVSSAHREEDRERRQYQRLEMLALIELHSLQLQPPRKKYSP